MINVNYYEQVEWNEDKISKVTVSDPPALGGMLSITQEYNIFPYVGNLLCYLMDLLSYTPELS